MPIYAEEICDMRTLLEYAENAATCEISKYAQSPQKLTCLNNATLLARIE